MDIIPTIRNNALQATSTATTTSCYDASLTNKLSKNTGFYQKLGIIKRLYCHYFSNFFNA